MEAEKKLSALELDLPGCPLWLTTGRCGCIPVLDKIAERMANHFPDISIEERQQIFLCWILGDDVKIGP